MGKSPFSGISAEEHKTMAKDSFFVSNGPFSLRFKKTPQKRGLAVVIGAKVLPRAVDRNRFRRLTREVFRQEKENLPKNTSFVVFMNQKISKNSLVGVKELIVPLLDKAFRPKTTKK